MAIALIWAGLLVLLAFWSFGVWAVHALGAWAAAHAGALTGVPDLVAALGLPAWVGPWIPPELAAVLPAMAAAVEPVTALLVSWAPALAGGLAIVAWIVWALGAFMLLLAGLAATVLLALLRRGTAGGAVQGLAGRALRHFGDHRLSRRQKA